MVFVHDSTYPKATPTHFWEFHTLLTSGYKDYTLCNPCIKKICRGRRFDSDILHKSPQIADFFYTKHITYIDNSSS